MSRGSVEYLRTKQQQQQRHQQRDMNTALPGPKDTSKEKALEKSYDYAKEVATMDAIRHMMTKYNRDIRKKRRFRRLSAEPPLIQRRQQRHPLQALHLLVVEAAAALLLMVLPFCRQLTPFQRLFLEVSIEGLI
ncbi:hypothetical protein Emag_005709 [Eimeria magna]